MNQMQKSVRRLQLYEIYLLQNKKKWRSTLLLAAQVDKMKRLLCSDWPPSGQDGRIFSTYSLFLLLLLLLLLFVWTPTPLQSMKYTTGVISYPDIRWCVEKQVRIWRHGWKLPRRLFANVDRLPRFTLSDQSRIFGLYFKRTQWLVLGKLVNFAFFAFHCFPRRNLAW